MSRSLFIRAVTTGFIFAAFILSLVISIPVIQGLYIIQIGLHFPGQASNYSNLTDIHFGVWAPCYCSITNCTCTSPGLAYSVNITNVNDPAVSPLIITPTWTRGMALHSLTAAVTGLAVIASIWNNKALNSITFLATLLGFIAFCIDIALIGHAEAVFKDADTDQSAGTAFWLSLVSFGLLLLASFAILCERRCRDRSFKAANATMNKA